jgi:photosystem II stability/assembly factor-like uncharacterized protein
MKIIFFIIIINYTLLITDCYPQWVLQNSGVSSALLDVDFINSQTGWACGDGGVILKTTNAGTNWIQQTSGITDKYLYGIDAINANVVFCVGWFQTFLKSTNGGINWIVIRNGLWGQSPSFFNLFFLNENTGWLLRNNYILRTTNGGTTFDSTYVIYSYLRDVYFKDALTGIICGDGALIIRSTDGGLVWNEVTVPHGGVLSDFFRISVVNNLFGWVIGRGNKRVYKTINFGITWDSIATVPYPAGTENYSVFFSSINTGWSGGTYGYVFKSTNGGLNWIQQFTPIDGFRNSFWFYNDSIGWVVGGGGYILQTTNGGTYLSITKISNSVPDRYILHQNFPNPFNYKTVIDFEICENNKYKLDIYDITGKLIEIVFDNFLTRGCYRITYNTDILSSGTYFYVLSSNGKSLTRKFTLLK